MNPSSLQLLLATIANGGTVSGEIDCVLDKPVRLSIPPAFTGTALTISTPNAASGAYQQLYNPDGTAYTITVAAGREVILYPSDMLGIQKFKLTSNAAEAAERVIGVYVAA